MVSVNLGQLKGRDIAGYWGYTVCIGNSSEVSANDVVTPQPVVLSARPSVRLVPCHDRSFVHFPDLRPEK